MSVTNPMNIPSFGTTVQSTVEIARSDYPNGLFSVSLAGNIHSLVIQENYTDLIIGTIYRDYGSIGTLTVDWDLSPYTATSNRMGDKYTLSTTQMLSSSAIDWVSFYVGADQYAISVEGDYSILYRWIGIYEEIQTFYVHMVCNSCYVIKHTVYSRQ